MPDSVDLTQASRLLARAADEVRVVNQPVAAASGPDVLSGGALGNSVDRFIVDSGAEAVAIAGELDDLAAEAARLAIEAEETEAALASTSSVGVGAV